MTGNVYAGVVVKTMKVASGPNSDMDVSVIVHTEEPFVAINTEMARALVLAEAAKAGVNINDPVAPVDVKLMSYS